MDQLVCRVATARGTGGLCARYVAVTHRETVERATGNVDRRMDRPSETGEASGPCGVLQGI